MSGGSVSFDRAAEYYDETRGLSDEGVRRTTVELARTFTGAGRVLEVGVGTGQIAIPLRMAGVDVVGIDLSRPMLTRLVEKAGGAVPFPLVEGDATHMPFADGAFDGAYLRWVLHLIPDWAAAVREIARVVGAGGLFLAALGSCQGAHVEIQAHFAETTGVSIGPVGLTWDGWDRLDAEVAALGGSKHPDVTFTDRERDDLETFVRGLEANRYSWTWAVRDEELRRRAAEETRRWAEARWGRLDRVPRSTLTWRFAVYRFPSSG